MGLPTGDIRGARYALVSLPRGRTPEFSVTTDGQAEIYLALRSWTDPRTHRTWIQVPIPGRPNGVVGWVPSTSLGPMHIVRKYLLIDRETLRATLFDQGRAIFSAPVGVGRPGLRRPPESSTSSRN